MNYARSERLALSNILLKAGPHAPTLCDGWTTRELAAHLVQEENDLASLPGHVWDRFSQITERRLYELSVRTPYPALVERIRTGTSRLSPLRFGPLEQAVGLPEFFVHHEDVRRAGPDPLPPRTLPTELQLQLWSWLKAMHRILLRKSVVSAVFESSLGGTFRTKPGMPTVYLAGLPAELLLYSFGRTRAADVEVIGSKESVALFNASLGI